MAHPEDMILPLLRKTRAEMARRFDAADGQLTQLAVAPGFLRKTAAGDRLMSRLVTANFGRRIQALEHKVRALEQVK